jgi:hypothetical protein
VTTSSKMLRTWLGSRYAAAYCASVRASLRIASELCFGVFFKLYVRRFSTEPDDFNAAVLTLRHMGASRIKGQAVTLSLRHSGNMALEKPVPEHHLKKSATLWCADFCCSQGTQQFVGSGRAGRRYAVSPQTASLSRSLRCSRRSWPEILVNDRGAPHEAPNTDRMFARDIRRECPTAKIGEQSVHRMQRQVSPIRGWISSSAPNSVSEIDWASQALNGALQDRRSACN